MKTLKLELNRTLLIVEGIVSLCRFDEIYKEFELLCKGSELTEDMAITLVDSWKSVAKDGTMIYENYKDGVPKCRTALDSFRSAVESKGFWWLDNPISKPNKIYDYYRDADGLSKNYFEDLKDWQEAEFRTFKNECLIFIKK